MRLIKLNESQYKRLFETSSFVKGAGEDGDLSSDNESLSPSETPTMTMGSTLSKDGNRSFVDGDNESRKEKYFGGSGALADVAAQDGYLTDKSRRY